MVFEHILGFAKVARVNPETAKSIVPAPPMNTCDLVTTLILWVSKSCENARCLTVGSPLFETRERAASHLVGSCPKDNLPISGTLVAVNCEFYKEGHKSELLQSETVL